MQLKFLLWKGFLCASWQIKTVRIFYLCYVKMWNLSVLVHARSCFLIVVVPAEGYHPVHNYIFLWKLPCRIGDQSLSEVVADVDGKSSGLHDKCKLSERICGQHLSKVVEAFIDRARKLENEFMR